MSDQPSLPLTAEEKAAAFDVLAAALTNCWASGEWSYWQPFPAGPMRQTREEAVADLIERCQRAAKRKPGLPMVEE